MCQVCAFIDDDDIEKTPSKWQRWTSSLRTDTRCLHSLRHIPAGLFVLGTTYIFISTVILKKSETAAFAQFNDSLVTFSFGYS